MAGAFIAGVGMTKAIASHKQTRSELELCREAAWSALEHAGTNPSSVEAVVVGHIDGLNGTNVGGRQVATQLLFGNVPVFVVSCGGQTGASLPFVASQLVRSGDYASVLCLGPPTFDGIVNFQKTIDMITAGISPDLGLGAVHIGSIFGAAYIQKHGLNSEIFAHVASKARRHALRNHLAQIREPLTFEQIMATPVISETLTLGMVCPVSSSAVALLVTTEERAKRLNNPLVEIRAINTKTDSASEGTRTDMSHFGGLRDLAQEIYRKSEITDPRNQLDVIEVFTPYAPFELMHCEALGLCEEGKGIELLLSGATSAEGDLPVNVSGGALCSNAGVAAELAPFGYVALQLMGQGIGWQIKGARRGLAHSMGSSLFMGHALGLLELKGELST